MCTGDIGLTGSLKDPLISVWGENTDCDFDKVSVFTDNLALTLGAGSWKEKWSVERLKVSVYLRSHRPCVCLPAEEEGRRGQSLSNVLDSPNFPLMTVS